MSSLFSSIPFAATINICVKNLFHNKARVANLSKESFKCLFELASLDSFVFIFNGKYYRQIDVLATDFPLG